MLKINVQADCGNSPKKLFLKDFNIAFAECNTEFLAQSVSEDLLWNIVGVKQIQGKSAFIETLQAKSSVKTHELTIHNIITHGREGAANGELSLEDGRRVAFCDVYEFKGVKGAVIKTLTSYTIPLSYA